MFLTLMVIGLAGLVLMAVPAFGRHGHAHTSHAGRAGHGSSALGRGAAHGRLAGTGRAGAAVARGAVARGRSEVLVADPESTSLLRFVPSPRAVCSVLALYGAFGNALTRAVHMPFVAAALVAVVPAVLVEWFAVRPVWNLVFRFQAPPCSPLADLILSEATAVVPFRNGRGIVSTVRDGRLVQLAARLPHDQASWSVKVGDRLRIEDVDAERERVTVTVLVGTDQLPP